MCLDLFLVTSDNLGNLTTGFLMANNPNIYICLIMLILWPFFSLGERG